MPESRGAVLAAISEVVRRLGAGEIETGYGGRLFYALELASRSFTEGTSVAVASSPAPTGRGHVPDMPLGRLHNIYQTKAKECRETSRITPLESTKRP